MANILIVDADLEEREQMVRLLTTAGYQVHAVNRGQEAMQLLQTRPIDAVLTELRLGDHSGLQLVEWIRDHYPRVPSVLITGRGNEEIAAESLQKGACSYIPKRRMTQDLVRTIENLLGLKTADRRIQQLSRCWLGGESRFELDATPEVIPPLVAHLQDLLQVLRFGDESTLMRIGVALTEALENAVYHGNLELSSELRKGDGQLWVQELQRRRGLAPYRDRKVRVTADVSRSRCQFTIVDEGPGFNPSLLPDPTDTVNLESVSGRGVYLIRMLMDEAHYTERGNELRMIKYATSLKP